MSRSHLLAVALCALCPSLPAQVPDTGRFFHPYPLGAFQARVPIGQVLPVWSLLDVREGFHEFEDQVVLFEVDQLVHLVGMLRPEIGESDIFVDPDQRLLMIGGRDLELGREVVALLADLELALTAPVTVRVAVVEHDGLLLPPSVLDAAQVRGILEGHRHLWTGRGRTWPGRTAYLGRQRSRPYVASIGAEVAQDASITRSIVRELFDGSAVAVTPHRLVGSSDLVLSVQFAAGRLREMARRSVEMAGVPDIDAPALAVTTGRFSGRIENDGALVFNAVGPAGGNLLVAVTAHYEKPQVALPDDFEVLPVSALVEYRDESDRHTDREAYRIGSPPRFREAPNRGPIVDDGRLQDLIRNLVKPDVWDDTAIMTYVAGHLYVLADEDIRKGAARVVQSLQEQWMHTVEVELRAPGAGDARIAFPALLGRSHPLMHGMQTTGVDGENVKIAQSRQVEIPNVVDLFAGFAGGVAVSPARDGVTALVELRQSRLGESERPRLLPAAERVRLQHDGAVELEQVIELGTGLDGAVTMILRRVN